jgi:hypothetical protein
MTSSKSSRDRAPNLNELAAATEGLVGVIWALEESGDLNANLVRFDAGGSVEEHASSAGTLVFVPKGVRRSTGASSDGFAYLTVHRRRGPLRIGGET